MATFIVSAILAVIVFFAARSCYRNFKSGKCAGCSGSCGCGCCDAKSLEKEIAANRTKDAKSN